MQGKETRTLRRILSVNVGVCRSEAESVIALIVKAQSMGGGLYYHVQGCIDGLKDG